MVVVVVVANDRAVVVMLLDGRVGVLDVAMAAVAVDGHPAGTDVDVLGESARGREDQGGGSGEGGKRDLHPMSPGFKVGLEMHAPGKPFRIFTGRYPCHLLRRGWDATMELHVGFICRRVELGPG
ncbi:hypothetical protein [Methylobacterium hispanicum]|uniref:hypothetical protein n=1 Tax=Methylobacterium hispanicum TaxID=270350 RepID=UPI002F358947